MSNTIRNLRYGLRQLRENPGFASVAILALALGIGANTAIYSVFYATLIADFPYRHSEQLVVVWSREAGDKNRNAVSTGDYLDWKRESTVFQILGVGWGSSFNLSIGEKPQQVLGDYLTPGFLDQLIGDRPFMGRYFAPEEGTPGKDHVVIITHKVRAGERFEALLFGGFASIALILAAVGICGVMSFAVAQRTHEIGLRMALGAGQDRVMRLIVREGMILALAGFALGSGGAVLVGRAMRGMWYQVGTIDVSALSAVSALLLASALLVCYLPARLATQVDPMQALREE